MIGRFLVAFGLTVGAAALAGDATVGERMFTEHCGTCHPAQQPLTPQLAKLKRQADKGARGAPDLTDVVRKKGLDYVRTWTPWPWKVNENTGCETRSLPANNLEDLISFLATRPFPPTPPLREKMKQELEARRDGTGGRTDGHGDRKGGKGGQRPRKEIHQ